MWRAFVVGVCAGAPSSASAHIPIEGINGFFVGLLHPLSTPPQLLALIALSLMAAARWPRGAQVILGGYGLALLGAIAAGLSGVGQDGAPPLLLAVATLTAALAALIAKPWLAVGMPLAAATGTLIGLVSVPDPGSPHAVAFTVSGSIVGAVLTPLYGAAAAEWLRAQANARWMEIAQRILAAWIAAVAMLLLALVFAPTDAADPPPDPPPKTSTAPWGRPSPQRPNGTWDPGYFARSSSIARRLSTSPEIA